jgi:hypothetical protein
VLLGPVLVPAWALQQHRVDRPLLQKPKKICRQLHQRDWKRFQLKVNWKRFHHKNQRLYCQTADLTMQT